MFLLNIVVMLSSVIVDSSVDLSIFSTFASLVLVELYDCISAGEVILEDMGENEQHQTKTKTQTMYTV